MTDTLLPAEPEKLDLLSGLKLDIRYVPTASLAAVGRKARTHSKAQIRKIADSVEAFGFAVPIIVDEDNKIIAGNARLDAAVLLGMVDVPVVALTHLTPEQKRLFVLAENKLATLAGYDKEVLRLEFTELAELDLDFSLVVTGFEEPEIDALMFGAGIEERADAIAPLPVSPTSRVGDLWDLGRHRLLCGDATDSGDVKALLDGQQVRTVFEDVPYNVRISGNVTSSDRHGEFVMASGEMSDPEFTAFLTEVFARLVEVLLPGGLAYVCIDFRHMANVLDAAKANKLEMLNLVVWDKGSGGLGSFYRSRHELIFVFAKSGDVHLNRVQLGKHGRDRHNVWCYPGVNGFGSEKARAREMHPTVKPFAMVRDAFLDSTARGDLVMDRFSGSGTSLIAAEESGRVARVMDLDPRYADTSIVRWQDFTGQEARLVGSGKTFREVRAERSQCVASAPPIAAADLPPARARMRCAA